jgi:RNA polymerase sigma-70 factor (ECF subfamily)
MSLADFTSTVLCRPRQGRVALTPGTLASRGERAELLRAAIGRLSEDHRVVLMLRYTQDMRYEQIAAYLDVPATTVRSRLHKAKQALRKGLAPLGPRAD